MERELICLFCSLELSEPSTTSFSDPSHRQNVFELISTSLSVESEVLNMWNFSNEYLPFCGPCQDSAHSFWKLHQQLATIQLEVAELVEHYKIAVKSSAKKNRNANIYQTSRFDNFRQQVLASSEIFGGCRNISRSRLNAVTGMLGEEDNMSVASLDNLSVCDSDSEDDKQSIKLLSIEEDNVDQVEDLGNLLHSMPKWNEIDGHVIFGHVQVIIPSGSSDIWKCTAEDCNFEFCGSEIRQPKKKMARHIEIKHYPSIECQTCCQKCKSLKDHICQTIKPKEKTPQRKCRRCNIVFENSSKLAIHECPFKNASNEAEAINSSKKKKVDFKCDICNKTLSSKAGLQRHKDTHTKSSHERKDKMCEKCGKKFTVNALVQHLRDVHGKGTPLSSFKCNVTNCTKTFSNNTRLRRHQESCNRNIISKQHEKKFFDPKTNHEIVMSM